jgi:hypothetical protein
MYMVIAMRAGNEGLLSGDSESEWGFEQLVALVSAFAPLTELIRGFYGKFCSR